jgi:hypothetical protein
MASTEHEETMKALLSQSSASEVSEEASPPSAPTSVSEEPPSLEFIKARLAEARGATPEAEVRVMDLAEIKMRMLQLAMEQNAE